MPKMHTAGWSPESPTPAQLSEFFLQIKSGRITRNKIQGFLGPDIFDFIDDVEVVPPIGVFYPLPSFDFQNLEGVKFSKFNAAFKRCFMKLQGENHKEAVLRRLTLTKKVGLSTIEKALGVAGECETRLSTLWSLFLDQPRGEDGILVVDPKKTNLFFIRDISGTTRGVDVHWGVTGGWNVEAWATDLGFLPGVGTQVFGS